MLVDPVKDARLEVEASARENTSRITERRSITLVTWIAGGDARFLPS